MTLSFDGLVFDVMEIEDWLREPVYDPSGVDFLYWHHVLDCKVLFGGDLNNRRRFPDLKNAPNILNREITDTNGVFAFKKGNSPSFPLISPNGTRKFQPNGIDHAAAKSDLGSAIKVLPGEVDLGGPQIGRATIENGRSNSLPWADADIRARLQLPRRQLLVWAYSGPQGAAEFQLISPLTGVDTDCRHGPVCTIMDLPKITGNAVSGIFRLRFETWERPFNNVQSAGKVVEDNNMMVTLEQIKDEARAKAHLNSQPAVISNRWKMRQEFDPKTYLSAVTTTGTAIVRMDVMKVKRVTVDQLRGELMHPVPYGYMRMPPSVEISPTGDAVSYEITDVEVMTNFPAGNKFGLLGIDIVQQYDYNSPKPIFMPIGVNFY